MLIYAGIGAHKGVPHEVQSWITSLAIELERHNWRVRSGGATECDHAWGHAVQNKEIHLPWPGYNGLIPDHRHLVPEFTSEIMAIAERHHPAWNRVRAEYRPFMYRNVTIILGRNLDEPANMVIGWTPGGQLVGGTAHGMRVAAAHGIPVFNLARDGDFEKLEAFANKLTFEQVAQYAP